MNYVINIIIITNIIQLYNQRECVKVPVPARQVLSLTEYTFEASYNMSATQVNKIYSMDQSEFLNLWAGIGTLTCSKSLHHV